MCYVLCETSVLNAVTSVRDGMNGWLADVGPVLIEMDTGQDGDGGTRTSLITAPGGLQPITAVGGLQWAETAIELIGGLARIGVALQWTSSVYLGLPGYS